MSALAEADVTVETRRCRSCGRRLFGRSAVCRSRKCPEYSRTWAGDQRRKLFENLGAYQGDVLMSAVTAPGTELLPWDEAGCAALGPHKHSGLLGCRVEHGAADEWNRTAPDRWRRLHRRAYQETVRRTGPKSVRLLARVWEIQGRGVLHVHPVLGHGSAAEMAGSRAYLTRLATLAPSYGFGFVDHSPKTVKAHPATGAAAYLSSYFVKGRGQKLALWESVRSEAMPRSIIHVSVQLTQHTRCTMRTLRLRRALFVLWGGQLPLEQVHLVGQFLEVFRGNVELLRVEHDGRPPPLSPSSCAAVSVAPSGLRGMAAGDGERRPGGLGR
jgi:hypothetical protein